MSRHTTQRLDKQQVTFDLVFNDGVRQAVFFQKRFHFIGIRAVLKQRRVNGSFQVGVRDGDAGARGFLAFQLFINELF